MQVAPIPDNEAARLQALHALLILGTPPEQRFDKIIQFAASEFEVPIALISLVDENRQWFNARVGLDVCETSRDLAFCAHALHSTKPLLIPNALEDVRFFDNPLVAGPPHIRFYVGAPLVMNDGLVIGTLCLIDTKPHPFDEMDLAILCTLRDLVVMELLSGDHAAGGAS